MSDNMIVARPYARAIFEIASSHNTIKSWSEILQNLAVIAENQLVQQFLTNPQVTWQQQAELFQEVYPQELQTQQKNLIDILAINNRLEFLPDIAFAFEKLYANAEGIIKAKVISAIPLTDTQKQALQNKLQKINVGAVREPPVSDTPHKQLDKNTMLEFEQDESIIGGLKIYIEDRVIDGSISGALDKLRTALWR